MGELVKTKQVAVGEYATPILQRAPRGRLSALRGMAFLILFLTSIVQLHAIQLMLLPLAILPATRPLFAAGIRFTKGSIGVCLGMLCLYLNQILYLTNYNFASAHVPTIRADFPQDNL